MKKIILALSLMVAPLITSANDLIIKKSIHSVDDTISNIECKLIDKMVKVLDSITTQAVK